MSELEGERARVLSNLDSIARRTREVIPFAADYANDDPEFDAKLDEVIRFIDRLSEMCGRDSAPPSIPDDWHLKPPASVVPKQFQWPSAPSAETPVFVRESKTGRFATSEGEKWWKAQGDDEEPFDEEDWGQAPTPIVRGVTDRELIDELAHRGYSPPPEWVEDNTIQPGDPRQQGWPGDPSDPDGPFK